MSAEAPLLASQSYRLTRRAARLGRGPLVQERKGCAMTPPPGSSYPGTHVWASGPTLCAVQGAQCSFLAAPTDVALAFKAASDCRLWAAVAGHISSTRPRDVAAGALGPWCPVALRCGAVVLHSAVLHCTALSSTVMLPPLQPGSTAKGPSLLDLQRCQSSQR